MGRYDDIKAALDPNFKNNPTSVLTEEERILAENSQLTEEEQIRAS